jgi:hypothetical protein
MPLGRSCTNTAHNRRAEEEGGDGDDARWLKERKSDELGTVVNVLVCYVKFRTL